nr:hypothetical protein [Tanacetum cinerariifolium]
MPRKDMDVTGNMVEETLKVVVLEMVDETTNDGMKKNLLMVVKEAIKLERENNKTDIAAMVVDIIRKEHECKRATLSSQVSNDVATNIPSQVDPFLRKYMNSHILHVHPTEFASSSILDLQQQLYLMMKDDKQTHDVDLPIWLALKYKYEKSALIVEPYRLDAFHSRDHEGHHDDDARPKGESSAKRQKTFEHGTYTRRESSLSRVMDESTLFGLSTQEQLEDFRPCFDDQRTDDDEVPSEKVSPELLVELLGKGTTGDDLKQTQDALNDMMQSRSPVFLVYERDPNAPLMTLLNQDLFYLKNGNSETKKYVLSLHKVHAFPFPEDDLEELNTRWARKIIKRFNLYARHVDDHWKNLWAKQEHIRRQLKKRHDHNEVYSEKRIIDILRVQSDQGHGQEYMKEIMVKRTDGEFLEFTELDYKYLHKNDIEDMYLMCMKESTSIERLGY